MNSCLKACYFSKEIVYINQALGHQEYLSRIYHKHRKYTGNEELN